LVQSINIITNYWGKLEKNFQILKLIMVLDYYLPFNNAAIVVPISEGVGATITPAS
jgi:hypothetical protein